MPSSSVTLTHETAVAAAPERLFDIVADTEGAPRYAPTQVHAEILSKEEGGEDLVRRWVYDGRSVRSWQVRRILDRAALRIVFTHVAAPGASPRGQRGEWSFTATDEGTTLVKVVHTLEAEDAEVLRGLSGNLDRNIPGQLGTYKFVGELGDNLARLYVSGSDSVVLPGTAADVFARLLLPEVWAALDPEPVRVSVRPLGDDTEFIGLAPAVDGLTDENSTETGYLRVLLSDREFAYKRLDLPPHMHAEIGRWTVQSAGPDKVQVTVGQSVTVNMNALASGVEEARAAAEVELRESLRRVLDAVAA